MERLNEDVGGRYRDALNTWMELCHGAIVLIDERARDESQWVTHEAAILSWRHQHDHGFPLIPVVVPPVTTPSLRSGRFEPTGLAELQCLHTDPPSPTADIEGIPAYAAAGGDPPAYIAAILAKLPNGPGGAQCPESIESIERAVSRCLAYANETALVDAALLLGEDLARWAPNLDRRRALARLLLQANPSRLLQALRSLELPKEWKRPIVELLSTCWIDLRAAKVIRDVASGPSDGWSLAINTKQTKTSRMYLWRVCGTHSGACWTAIEVAIGFYEDVVEALVQQIDDYFIEKHSPGQSAEEIRAWLRRPADEHEPIVILLPPPEPQKWILDSLRHEYPRFLFFILAADSRPPADRMPTSGAQFIRPEIDAALEKRMLGWSTDMFISYINHDNSDQRL